MCGHKQREQRKRRNCNTPDRAKTPLRNFMLLVLLVLWLPGRALALDMTDVERWWAGTPEHQFFSGKNGVPIAYKVIPHPRPRGIVVIVSGRTESFIKYQEFSYALYQAGYSIYQHDHRGQGLSGRLLDDPRKGHVDHFADYVDDFKVFMAEKVPAGELPVYLYSHSMGGSVVIQYLALVHDRVTAAVLGSPMLAANTGPPGTCALATTISWFCPRCSVSGNGPTPFAENQLTHSEMRYEWKFGVYARYPGSLLGAPTFGWVAQACAIRAELQADAARIAAPVLVLQAGADTVVHNDKQDEFCARNNAKGGAVCIGGRPEIIAGARHELVFEEDDYRSLVVARVLAFFAEYQ